MDRREYLIEDFNSTIELTWAIHPSCWSHGSDPLILAPRPRSLLRWNSPTKSPSCSDEIGTSLSKTKFGTSLPDAVHSFPFPFPFPSSSLKRHLTKTHRRATTSTNGRAWRNANMKSIYSCRNGQKLNMGSACRPSLGNRKKITPHQKV